MDPADPAAWQAQARCTMLLSLLPADTLYVTHHDTVVLLALY